MRGGRQTALHERALDEVDPGVCQSSVQGSAHTAGGGLEGAVCTRRLPIPHAYRAKFTTHSRR